MAPIYLKNILLNLPGSVYWKDKNGVYLGCNNFQAKMAGLNSPEEIIGKTDYDLSWKDIAPILAKTEQEIMTSGIPKEIIETPKLSDGRKLIMITNKAPLFNERGEIIGIVGTSIDITKQKKLEDELREMTQKLENVLNTIPGHVYWKDINGVYLGCNDLQARDVGLTKEEMIGKTDYDVASRDVADKLRRIDKKVMEEKKAITIEEEAPALGVKRIYLSQKTPLFDYQNRKKVTGLLGVSLDITEKKQVEKELSEIRHKLDGMTLVSASIAHELRTPLQTLSFAVCNLRKYYPNLLDVYKKAVNSNLIEGQLINKTALQLAEGTLDRMEREIKFGLMTIDLLLVNLKPDIDTKVSREECSITSCISESLDRYPFKEDERELISWEPNSDFVFLGNRRFIVHVFFNLIKNSLYQIAKAGKGLISIKTDEEDDYNIISFKDTATGIPKFVVSRIFDRFFSKSDHGAGVGLTFCKMVMDSLGGEMKCESQEGEYTIFRLFFPKYSSIKNCGD